MKIKQMLMRTILFLLLIVTCLYLRNAVASDAAERLPLDTENLVVNVDTTEPLTHVEEYFISFNIDCQEFSEHFEKMNFRFIYLLTFLCWST